MSIITLYIVAHGLELTGETPSKFNFTIPSENITILACGLGSGICGDPTHAIDKKESDLYEKIIENSINLGNETQQNTLEIMENAQNTFRERSLYFVPNYKYKKYMTNTTLDAIERNNMCRIRHPFTDKAYSFEKYILNFGPINPYKFTPLKI